ncbi:MAG: hypothetical protein STHCBS139747_004346 [Sporothrix thermara]
MLTATVLDGYHLLNNGPLTTTFTAASSCTTAFTVLAPVTQTDPPVIAWYADCSARVAPGVCSPPGAPLSSFVSLVGTADPRLDQLIIYYSPGYICPAGWTTAGLASRTSGGDSETITAVEAVSGAFDVTSYLPTLTGADFVPPVPAVLADALVPGETAMLCCPTSFTGSGGACYSVIPTSVYKPTAGCLPFYMESVQTHETGTYTIEGQTLTDALVVVTATGPQAVTTTTTVFATPTVTSGPDAVALSYVGVLMYNAVLMVHQASDVAGTVTGTGAAGTAVATTTGASQSAATRKTGLGAVAVGCMALVLSSLIVL